MYCRLAVLMAQKDPHLSQRQVARETGLSVTTINKLYGGYPGRIDPDTVVTICEYFKCGIADLFEIREVAA